MITEKFFRKIILIAGICPLLFFVSCDPAAIIRFSTSSVPGISVKAYVKKAFLPYFLKAGETEIISVSSDQPRHDTLFLYGIGTWPKERVKEMAGYVDSIVIVHTKSVERYNSQAAIEKFLLAHRRGILKQRIDIRVKR